MTKEDFDSKFYSHCWVARADGNIYCSFYYDGEFYDSHYCNERYEHDEIKAVMPIVKPEFPKEVG